VRWWTFGSLRCWVSYVLAPRTAVRLAYLSNRPWL
jgi:hypothetical protein